MATESAAAPAELPDLDPVPLLSRQLELPQRGVQAVVALLGDGATVPFVARYRKEATGGLDEVQIRRIQEQHGYLVELHRRRRTVLAEIAKQGKLDDGLRKKILAAATKAELEDLYQPFKPKRRTRATIARERGLEPLADRIWAQPDDGDPERDAGQFVSADKGVEDVVSALGGARDICAERIADDAERRQLVRHAYAKEAALVVGKAKKHRDERTKFDDYDGFQQRARDLPSHRYLAIRRGESEGVLKVSLDIDGDELTARLRRQLGVKSHSWGRQLTLALDDAFKRLLAPRAEAELRAGLKETADQAAVEIFARNLRQLLLAAPFGTQRVLGIDPGQRTGCKCAAVDGTGKLLEHATIYLVQGDAALASARETVLRLCRRHEIAAVAVGNGTYGRETESFVRETLRAAGLGPAGIICVSVSEAGASVYSASELARRELPDLDLTIRGAVSIARRLQDPLAELVKVDPQSIGVGQYQHDVSQTLLAKKLDDVVESCVNAVGVELNTASAALLGRVAGIGPALANKIVAHRDACGAFKNRRGLLKVSSLGAKTFQQAAGFLRIRGGDQPLDQSAVHPERYGLVERIAKDLGVPVASLIGNAELIARIDKRRYFDAASDVGEFTMDDIAAELAKPGRDPRATFEPPKFRDDVRTLEDLRPEMVLEGVVTNVTGFGAFVDLGVHQDGLVHISQLADRFVKDPNEIVSVGDKIRVRVLSVDLERRRISLSAKRGAPEDRSKGDPPDRRGGPNSPPQRSRGGRPRSSAQDSRRPPRDEGFRHNPFAKHFRKK